MFRVNLHTADLPNSEWHERHPKSFEEAFKSFNASKLMWVDVNIQHTDEI